MTKNDTKAGAGARRFLREQLAGGARAAREVLEAGKLAGFKRGALHRACKRLGITPNKAGFLGGWTWVLPTPDSHRLGGEGQDIPPSANNGAAPPSDATIEESQATRRERVLALLRKRYLSESDMNRSGGRPACMTCKELDCTSGYRCLAPRPALRAGERMSSLTVTLPVVCPLFEDAA
ncbi:hypothetical protein [Candidatus Symbiobacter mobilis]|uniref:Uncharacterized protein n=1 Tax=Candidatus Symbiobacter mobilis CR TaxID=946483 RepID=U5NCZ9_9BURK|nr:hypothetical protein [Candidatus Symbiobacter mobilis]AGX88044.1 hypothetical protein Cenrod_1968 [Candidatus Symbiobacter mobilis CR]